MLLETLSCRKLCGVTQFLQGEHFLPSNSLLVNAGVWWWCTENASSRERVQGLQKWTDNIHYDDITISPADQGHVNIAQLEELVLRNQQDTIWDLSTIVEHDKQVPGIHGHVLRCGVTILLKRAGHIHLQWEPQNVKCASMLEDYGFCILFRSHQR